MSLPAGALHSAPMPGLGKKMALYREDMDSLPQEYISGNKTLAESTLESLRIQHSLTVHRTWISSDGWADGMQSLYAIIETAPGRLHKLVWHDEGVTSDERCQGTFFICSPNGGGSFRSRDQDFCPSL